MATSINKNMYVGFGKTRTEELYATEVRREPRINLSEQSYFLNTDMHNRLKTLRKFYCQVSASKYPASH